MVELVARQTPMPVLEAVEAQLIEVNHVYIIPPNKFLAITDGRLRLPSRRNRAVGRRPSILSFALWPRNKQERSIGIVLSGTGSHGTPGIKEIKLAGGMAMVQQPESADFDQMPTNAIATGLVDYVLTPEQMPEACSSMCEQPYVVPSRSPSRTIASTADLLIPHPCAGQSLDTLRLSALSQEHGLAAHPAPDGAVAGRTSGRLSRNAPREPR